MRPAPLRPAAAAVAAPVQPQRYLTNDEAAEYLRLSPRTLEKQRVIGGGPKFRSSAAASCTRWPTSMPGPTSAATRPRPTRNMPSVTRATTVMAADRRLAGGHRHVQPIAAVGAAIAAAGTARPVPRAAGRRHGAARQPDLMAFPFFSLAKSAHGADRLPQREHHHPRGRHGRARHRHDMGCRRVDLGGLADRGGARRRHSPVALDTRHALRNPALHRARHVLNDYQRLKAALDRLQSTSVATSIRETTGRRLHRFRG